MDAVELKKPDGTTFVVHDRRSQKVKEQHNRLLVNQPPTKTEQLLPAGFQSLDNGEIETPVERGKRLSKNQKSQPTSGDNGNVLLPAGVELED